jgi:HlyD family secretion protein
MKTKYILILVASLTAGLACSDNYSRRDLKFSGTLELTEHVLGAKAGGRVATLTVDEGDEVKAGQLLATLDRYEQTKKDYDRTNNLMQQGGMTKQSLEYAALSLDDQQIVSPVDGVVLVKVHEMGETVQPGSAVVVVGDRSKLWVKIFVPEGRINQIELGQAAVLSFDGLKEKFNGHVSFISSQAEFTPRNVQSQEERVTQTFAVKIVLDDVKSFLRPGVAADVEIKVNKDHDK